MHNILEVDLTEAKASLTCNCDNCGATLGESWASGRDNLTVGLTTKDDKGYERYKTYHLCNESCLLGLLQKRAPKSA